MSKNLQCVFKLNQSLPSFDITFEIFFMERCQNIISPLNVSGPSQWLQTISVGLLNICIFLYMKETNVNDLLYSVGLQVLNNKINLFCDMKSEFNL